MSHTHRVLEIMSRRYSQKMMAREDMVIPPSCFNSALPRLVRLAQVSGTNEVKANIKMRFAGRDARVRRARSSVRETFTAF